MRRVVINKFGTNLDVSPDGVSRLPVGLRDLLAGELTYTQVLLMRGRAAYDEFGHRTPVRTQRKAMYVWDGRGRLVCKAGFLDRLIRVLKQNEYEVVVNDKTPPHPRSDRFDLDWGAVFNQFDPRARQDEALLKIATNDRGVIEAPTGFGKSYMFKMVGALYPNARILVVVSRKDVAQDIHRDLTRYFPNVGMIGAGRRRAGRITVCMAQSLQHAGYEDWDIILGDEVHELGAPTVVGQLANMKWAKCFGFSASPWGRQDGTSIRIEAIFGNTIFYMSYQEAVALGLVVPIRVEWLDVIMDENPAQDYEDVARLRRGLWRNEYRNQMIAAKARSYGPDEQVLIMVAHFEHAIYLKQQLPEFVLCYAERKEDDRLFDRAVRDGLLPFDELRMTDRLRMQRREQFETGELKKAIATDVWSTGVNFQQLQVLIRADARSSSIKDTQIPGRVSRTHNTSGKQVGILVDCLDQFDEGFRDAARKRRRDYRQKGWEEVLPTAGPRLLQQ